MRSASIEVTTAGSVTRRAADISGFPSVRAAIRWMRDEGVGHRGEDRATVRRSVARRMRQKCQRQ